MRRKKSVKNKKNNRKEILKRPRFILPERAKRHILGVVIFLITIILAFSFFENAGVAGRILRSGLFSLIGKGVFFLPLILVLAGLVCFFTQYKNFLGAIFLASLFLITGLSGILGSFKPVLKEGGSLGYLSKPLLNFFGFWVTEIIFGAFIIIGGVIFWQLLRPALFREEEKRREGESETEKGIIEEKKPFITRIFRREPEFKIKEIESAPVVKEPKIIDEPVSMTRQKPATFIGGAEEKYQPPPLDLLESERSVPSAGDIRQNSAIIKKTLQNLDVPVEMSEVNIGPTVTQYTLKPADGVKLSKITVLSNDLALSLAAHPIRIEAPIPGKSLVGIEVPNKIRARVRLKDLFFDQNFQKSNATLIFALGRDVSGNSIFADLAKMPHFLVAGSTGTGKTIFLNSLILSLLYKNGPDIMRFILIDPKRVEFPVYNDLPHLLCPVIYDAQKAVGALKWLISEMERRFDILAKERARDIIAYNEIMNRKEKESSMPYIVLIIDELADLMAARGREIEAGIVRIAQLARAVGIHLVVATQRPSVEVITGLIKANITSRITFQVASQIDSRTVLDMAGAEKLLGAGDLLFISAEITKPKRIQGAFVSEKEVKKVVNFVNAQNAKLKAEKLEEAIWENQLSEELEKTLEEPETTLTDFYGDDPLYEEAKRVVIEAKKASASLLQRRLRIGYARAARLLDILEEKEVVGPGEGAKPRQVFWEEKEKSEEESEEGEDNEWQKV